MNNVGQTEKKHALLSASTAHRWLTCTPSAVLEREEHLDECSVYAAEGIAAHALADIKLSYMFNQIQKEEYEQKLEEFMKNPETSIYFNKEFEEYVDGYVSFVKQKSDELGEDTEVAFEVRVDFSNIVPEGFGTADAILVNRVTGCAHIIDLKFGQGVPVTAKDNPQLKLYAFGVCREFFYDMNVEKIFMTIYQPRIDNIDTDCVMVKDLIMWAYHYVKPRAELAIKGEGKLQPTESACRFCKLKGKCKARADLQLEVAQKEFEIVDNRANLVQNMSVEQISNILQIAPMFIEWFKDVQAYALGQLMRGVKIPGYKLVEGRSNRIITDAQKVKEVLLSVGLKENEIMKPPEIQGITNLEKIVGKRLFNELCGEYIIKPMGKLTLAPDTDRRPEVSTIEIARNDFDTPIEEE
jgi:hypothetical protein